jgi:hypothetical protein
MALLLFLVATMLLMDCVNILFWSVRGLNSRARRDVVAGLVVQERVSLLCLQETKLHVIDATLMTNSFVLTNGTWGSILIA